MILEELNQALEKILKEYGESFASKVFGGESREVDDLMLVFGLTQQTKARNKQYWGRELGKCWERLVIELCRRACDNFREGIKEGADELCDLVVGKDAIDTKYRIGSGDSGTLKKFKQYGRRLKELGLRPIQLIVRTDNLPAAITACITGGWEVKSGVDAYRYLQTITKFDIQPWLRERKDRFSDKS